MDGITPPSFSRLVLHATLCNYMKPSGPFEKSVLGIQASKLGYAASGKPL